MLHKTLSAMLAVCLISLGVATLVQGAEGPPNYQLQYLGPGSPVAVNNNGVVVGALINGSNYQPLVSVNGSTWVLLPVPNGAMSVFPTDVNDSGVIVGVSYSTGWIPSAVRWNPTESGYAVEVLPRLPGDNSSYATNINNLGQIVGARQALGYVPTGSGWLYSETLGVVNLSAQYGLWVVPLGINDAGLIIGGVERLDLTTGVIDDIGSGPSNYNPVTPVAINNSGMMAGSASLRSTSLNIISVFRYEGVAGWRFIAGTSRYTIASSINNQGDIGYGEQGAGLYLDGLGLYALGSLLDPAVTNAGWAITGSSPEINDQRVVATTARNSITGETGGVLLTPTGTLQPPTAPANLQGLAHPATRLEPFNSINLTWENTSPLTRAYELERREVGGTTWTLLSLTPPGTATNHTDTTVGVGITYEYRIRAVGLGGTSPWSNVVTVTSPTTPLDTTPPVVTIVSPSNGATVSGTVTVSALATDNVAVEYLEISYWNQYLGQQVILGSVSNAGALSANWDTRSLTPAAYALRAYAYDTLGNWTQTDITVNVGASATSTGFLSPSANAAQTSSAGDNNGYQTNPAQAYANDASVATDTNSGTNNNTSCANSGKDKHHYSNYNFNLPATAVVQSIQVRLDARADATGGAPKICVQLSWNGGATWTTAKSTVTLSTTETTYTLGGLSDTWGRTWTSSHLNNANFRLRIINVASNTSRDFFLDYVAVNVTYQP